MFKKGFFSTAFTIIIFLKQPSMFANKLQIPADVEIYLGILAFPVFILCIL